MRRTACEPKPDQPRGKLIDGLLSDFLEPTLIQPTFLYDYPRDISPLAKSIPGDPTTVERFEGFIGWDGAVQCLHRAERPAGPGSSASSRWAATMPPMMKNAIPMDEDYLRAMRYGMPPNGGFGMGIDRLTMLLTDSPNIREVILFPHLRSREEG